MAIFDSAIEKINRAEEQTEALEREIAAFLAEKTYETREHLNAETGRKTALFYTTRAIPDLRWSVIVGEIFHNLRSALDHAITDLTIAEQGHPLQQTGFPIFEDEAAYKRLKNGEPHPNSGLHKIRGVSDGARAAINWLQPFEVRRRRGGGNAALTTLRVLNNIDKHRAVHVIRASAEGGGWRLLRQVRLPIQWRFPVGEIEDGTEVAEWTPISPVEGEMDMEFDFNFSIIFSEPFSEISNLRGANVAGVCESCARGVRWIIGRLGGDTDTPPP